MKTEGFAAFEDGTPVMMELGEDITAGIYIEDVVPVFKTAEDAESAVLSNQSRFGSKATFEIRKVTIEVGEVVNTVTYDEDAEEDAE